MGEVLPLAKQSEVARALREFLPARAVLHEEEDTRPYECDGLTAYRQLPMVVALPETEEQVRRVLQACSAMAVPVVPRGAGTGLSGGALPPGDGVLLSMAKFMRVLRVDPLARLAVVAFVATVAFSAFEATFSLFGKERFALREGSTSAVFVCIGLLLVAVQVGLVRRVAPRYGGLRTLRAGLVANAAGLLLMAAATEWIVLVPALVLLVVGQGLTSPSLAAVAAGRARADRRGAVLGIQQSVGGLARVVGPAVGGLLFQHAGVPWPYLVGAGLLAAAGVLLLAEHEPAPASRPAVA